MITIICLSSTLLSNTNSSNNSCTKKVKSQTLSTKKLALHMTFVQKKFLIKCWWNKQLLSLNCILLSSNLRPSFGYGDHNATEWIVGRRLRLGICFLLLWINSTRILNPLAISCKGLSKPAFYHGWGSFTTLLRTFK